MCPGPGTAQQGPEGGRGPGLQVCREGLEVGAHGGQGSASPPAPHGGLRWTATVPTPWARPVTSVGQEGAWQSHVGVCGDSSWDLGGPGQHFTPPSQPWHLTDLRPSEGHLQGPLDMGGNGYCESPVASSGAREAGSTLDTHRLQTLHPEPGAAVGPAEELGAGQEMQLGCTQLAEEFSAVRLRPGGLCSHRAGSVAVDRAVLRGWVGLVHGQPGSSQLGESQEGHQLCPYSQPAGG